MKNNKKAICLAITAAILSTSVTPAFAKVVGYVTEKDGVLYQYDKTELKSSIIGDGALYAQYNDGKLKALLDDKNGYIDANDVRQYIINEDKIDVDAYTESDKAEKSTITEAEVKKVDKDGNVIEKPVEEGLKVESVSAINANYVVVKITAPEKDMLAQEVEVKNGAGVVVPVKPLDIAAGDKTAEFEFVTAVKAADLKGVWTVNDQSYDLDLYNNLSAFLNAGDQLALNKALTDLGIKNVDIANMPAYFEAKDELDKTALELTVADVQKLVDDVNAKFVSAEEEAAIVKAVVDSLAGDTVNQVALLQALQNKAFVRVNADWVADATNGYAVKLKGANLTKDSKIKDIQTVINTSNDALIKAELDKLKTDNDYTELDKAKLTKVKNLIATYATVDDKGVIDNADIKAAVEGKVIEIQLALADVVAATTPTSLKNRVVALNELLAKENKIDMEKEYIDANAKDYITQIEKNKVNTVTKLKTAISTVNTSASSELLDNVKNATDADALLKALKAFPGLKQVSDTNKDLYYKETTVEETTTKNVNFKDVTADTIQKAVDDQNLVAIKAADKDSIIEKLNVLELKNVVAENAEAYAKSAKASEVEGSISKATDAETMQKAVNAVNQTVVENAQLKAINEAKTVAEVKSALDALANVDKAADYLTIRSVDRDFVAAHVLENRPEENGYAKIDDVETAIGKEAVGETSATGAIKAYHEALDGINSITRTSTPVEVANALGNVLDEDFAKLSNTEKTAKAEAFQAKLTFDEKGALKTTFVTLADVKALLK